MNSEETSTVHDDWVAVKNSYSLASEIDRFYMAESIEAPLFKAMKSSIQANRDDILVESGELERMQFETLAILGQLFNLQDQISQSISSSDKGSSIFGSLISNQGAMKKNNLK